MLPRIYPHGAVLKDVKWVSRRYGIIYGRQIASYAITVKLHDEILHPGFMSDVVVSNHGERSLTGFIPPLHINTAPEKMLSAVYGVGKKRAASLKHHRPFLSLPQAGEYLASVPNTLQKHILL